MPVQIEVTGALTIADLRRFQYFHAWSRRLSIAACVIVATILMLLLLTFYLSPEDNVPTSTMIPNAAPFFILILLWIAVLGLAPYFFAKRQWATQPYLGEPTSYVFTAESIRTSRPSMSSDVKWSAVREIRETKSLFLIYYGLRLALPIPKRFFQADSERENWKELASSAIAPRKFKRMGMFGKCF